MTSTAPRTTAGRWALTVALVAVSLIAGGTFGFVALISGSDVMAASTANRAQSLVMWTLAGAALAAPVAALPMLGFVVRRRTTWPVAGVIAGAVVLVCLFGLNQP